VLPLLERFKDPSDPAIAATRSNIAVIYMQQGNYAAAELLLLESLGQETHHADRPDERIPTSLNQLVRAYLGQGKVDEAEKLLRGCVAIWEQHGWPRSSVTAGILDSYVELLEGSGRAAEAAAVRSRIAELMSEPELG